MVKACRGRCWPLLQVRLTRAHAPQIEKLQLSLRSCICSLSAVLHGPGIALPSTWVRRCGTSGHVYCPSVAHCGLPCLLVRFYRALTNGIAVATASPCALESMGTPLLPPPNWHTAAAAAAARQWSYRVELLAARWITLLLVPTSITPPAVRTPPAQPRTEDPQGWRPPAAPRCGCCLRAAVRAAGRRAVGAGRGVVSEQRGARHDTGTAGQALHNQAPPAQAAKCYSCAAHPSQGAAFPPPLPCPLKSQLGWPQVLLPQRMQAWCRPCGSRTDG